jgi:hypothetical protein
MHNRNNTSSIVGQSSIIVDGDVDSIIVDGILLVAMIVSVVTVDSLTVDCYDL